MSGKSIPFGNRLFWTRDEFDRLVPISLGLSLFLYGIDKAGLVQYWWMPHLYVVFGIIIILMGYFIRIKRK